MKLDLYPMSFSKAKTVAKVLAKLEKSPAQLDNSPEAWEGLVMEFRTADDHRPATLAEYNRLFGVDEATLHLADGLVTVKLTDGKWIVRQMVAAL